MSAKYSITSNQIYEYLEGIKRKRREASQPSKEFQNNMREYREKKNRIREKCKWNYENQAFKIFEKIKGEQTKLDF